MFDDRITQNSRSVQDNLISRHNHFKCELLLAPLNSQICVVLVAEVGPSVILQSVVRPVVIPQSPGQVL